MLAAYSLAAQAAPPAPPGTAEVLGYLENWNDVIWWDNGIPQNCVQGCFEVEKILNKTAAYSAINYGFVFFSGLPTPDQVGCEDQYNKTTHKLIKLANQSCPVWDGKALYMSAAEKDGSHAIDSKTTLDDLTPGLVSIAETVRLMKMHPAGPKRTKITLGGWSDFARLGSIPNAQKAAALAAKMVQYTFADGIDIDLEHLVDQAKVPKPWHVDEFEAWAMFFNTLRKELDGVSAKWVETASKRRASLLKQHATMDKWSKGVFAPFMNTTIEYLNEVAANGPPHLEISWTTRFNAFVPTEDPYNYVKKWLGTRPKYNSNGKTFPSDNEGVKLWPQIHDVTDTVNIMAYDAANITFDFKTILDNFVSGGVSKEKINLGFEPGNQLHEATWEGKGTDLEMAKYIKEEGFSGVMVWAVNPAEEWTPKSYKACPETAAMLKKTLEPSDRFKHLYEAPHTYTKCDPKTGWRPKVAKQLALEQAAAKASKHGADKQLNVLPQKAKGKPTRPALSRPLGGAAKGAKAPAANVLAPADMP
jgi:GH18 family chitinase